MVSISCNKTEMMLFIIDKSRFKSPLLERPSSVLMAKLISDVIQLISVIQKRAYGRKVKPIAVKQPDIFKNHEQEANTIWPRILSNRCKEVNNLIFETLKVVSLLIACVI